MDNENKLSEQPISEQPNPEQPVSDLPIETPEELSEICHYLRLLGEGSNGRTWLASNLKDGSRVAVKELKSITGFKQLELFRREEEVLRSIHVEGVPRLLQSVFSDTGCYIIQEYVPYPSLQDLLNQGHIFTEDETLQIIKAIARILNELETYYIPPVIHRDIKPSNIMYNRMPQGGVEVYLIDFGAVANPQKQSEGSTVAGTFGYMAPELLQGESRIQSDFYALGATAVHLMTGVSPYKISTNVFELEFEPVIKEKAPKTTPQTIELLHKLLAPQADARPQTAKEIIELVDHPKENKHKHNLLFSFFEKLKHKKETQNNFNDMYGIDLTASIKDCYYNEEIRLEYIYVVEGKTYSGICLAEKVRKIETIGAQGTEGIASNKCSIHLDFPKSNPAVSYAIQGQTIVLSDHILELYNNSLKISNNIKIS